MGHYIETMSAHGKAATILAKVPGTTRVQGTPRWEDLPEGKAYICVVDNYIFEAAGFAYSEAEFNVFADPKDSRPKEWLIMDRVKAEELSGFNNPGGFPDYSRAL
jgi:hypothetical protein